MPEKLAAFTIRLTARDLIALRRLAEAEDRHTAAYVRRLIERHIKSKARKVSAA